MNARDSQTSVLDKLVRVGFLLATLATVGALAAATIDFDIARPIAIVAGVVLILCVALSAARQKPDASLDVPTMTQINPATGLPMLGNTRVDIRGNAYGRNDH
jgi:hypothetical protein